MAATYYLPQGSPMNREETLALYEQGADAWNKWANEMLEERKQLEEAGEWDTINYIPSLVGPLFLNFQGIPFNEKTRNWYKKSEANFSTKENPYRFSKSIDLSSFIFPSIAMIESAVFEKDCTLNEMHFLGEANFDNSVFIGSVHFNETIFESNAKFENSNFHEMADFTGVTFSDEAWFAHSTFCKTTLFIMSTFEGLTTFSAIQAKRGFSLSGASFVNEIPYFKQANFQEAPHLDDINFSRYIEPKGFINSILNPIASDLKARYQALKRIAVQAHDHENEQRFWAGELRSDRSLRTEDGGWNLRPLVSAFWWGNIAYGCFSDYGYSIVKPLISLFILLCIMTNIHIYAHHTLNKEPSLSSRTKTHITKQSNLKDCDIRSSAFRVAAKNGAIGLLQNPAKRSTFVRDYTCLYGTYNDNTTPKIPNSIFWIELFHTLFSAILIFLTLLGIRNNFKLK